MPTERLQLSFDIGGRRPDTASLKLSGALSLQSELAKGAEIHITIAGADGEVVAQGYGRCVSVAFKDSFDEFGDVCETTREHGIKLA